jgi:hypothetical protein
MKRKNSDLETIPIHPEKKDMNPYLCPMVYMSTAAIVADYFGFTKEQIIKNDRHTPYRQARQIAMWLDHRFVKECTGYPGWSVIARRFKRNHATVIHSVKTVENDMLYDDFKKMVQMVQRNVFGKVMFY